MRNGRVVVIGAGLGGLAAAIHLAAAGLEVLVIERAGSPGGKMRELSVGGQRIDAGPTVLTMRWVFEELFAVAGGNLADVVRLRPADLLARHGWAGDAQLDLHADRSRTADAIGRFAGAAEARGYLAFADRAARVYQALEDGFIRSPRPTPLSLVRAGGLRGARGLWSGAPFASLWQVLGEHFRDPRLRQLFGRYATYCGGSPFLAPAVLMLIAHVEQQGVWLVEGGMQRLADALAAVAAAQGVRIRFGADVTGIDIGGGGAVGVSLAGGERLDAAAVVLNGDVAALAAGCFGETAARAMPDDRAPPSLSAVTWAAVAETSGFPLTRHNVFFSDDYAAEFADLFGGARLPRTPTVYVCAQDRDAAGDPTPGGAERLFLLVNAPAAGDGPALSPSEIEQCEKQIIQRLARCGLTLSWRDRPIRTAPKDFASLFPGTGGALYGRAPHGWKAAFQRPSSRTRIPGLYLAGGSTHPGPGVPMAALSGRLAAAALLEDLASTSRSSRAAMPGGMSTR